MYHHFQSLKVWLAVITFHYHHVFICYSGRAIRSRASRHTATDVPVSPEVLGGAVGFTPASSLRRRHSRGEVDPVTVVQQLENDEEYARKLQVNLI